MKNAAISRECTANIERKKRLVLEDTVANPY